MSRSYFNQEQFASESVYVFEMSEHAESLKSIKKTIKRSIGSCCLVLAHVVGIRDERRSDFRSKVVGMSQRPRPESVVLLVILAVLVNACGSSPSASDVEQLPLASSSLEAGEPARFEQGTHCGFRVLDTMINGQVWRAEGASDGDWFPSGWTPESSDGPVTIQLVLAGDEATIAASMNGTEVTYVAGGNEWQGADFCA